MFELKSCPKKNTVDQDKAESPGLTADRVSRLLKETAGLETFKLEQRKSPIDSAFSFASSTEKFSASGKGLSADQSKASAVMEFAERYSWLHFDYKNYDGYIMRSFNEMKEAGLPTVDETYFLNNFIDLDNRRELLEDIKNIPLKWIRGYSLTSKTGFYYPINWHNNIFSSNGLASGNTIEEAILQAICELIERENVYRLFVESRPGKDLDLGSITDPLIKKTMHDAELCGTTFNVKEISSDLAVPTFVVQGTNSNDIGKLTYKGCGQGTSPDPVKALTRSLAEYFEGYLIVSSSISRMKFDPAVLSNLLPKKHMGFLTLYNPEILEKSIKTVALSDIPGLNRNDIKDEIELILDILKALGHEVVVIDKTHPNLRIPVVRIFIPKMRSCLNTEIALPESIIAQVCYEAGEPDMAKKYILSSVRKDPIMNMLGGFVSQMPADLLFKKDYLEGMVAYNALKKNGIEMINQVMSGKSGFKLPA